MKWMDLTSAELGEAAKTTGVCVLPMGVLEKHGDHLPLGMDMFFSDYLATHAAELEPAVVFPNHFYGQIAEGKHWPGTIAIRHDLMLSLLETPESLAASMSGAAGFSGAVWSTVTASAAEPNSISGRRPARSTVPSATKVNIMFTEPVHAMFFNTLEMS